MNTRSTSPNPNPRRPAGRQASHSERRQAMEATHEPETGKEVLRLLVPVTAEDDSRWGVAYALRRHADRQQVDVCLLNVGEFIDQWEVLRYRTQAEIAAFQLDRAEGFFDEAAEPLRERGIPWRGIFRRGKIVFTILDAAEELGCHEIVMPRSDAGLFGILSRRVVSSVVRRRRNIPVILVDRDGTPGPRA